LNSKETWTEDVDDRNKRPSFKLFSHESNENEAGQQKLKHGVYMEYKYNMDTMAKK
jgi:hypothetical protein